MDVSVFSATPMLLVKEDPAVFFVFPKPGKHKIWPASYGPFGSLRVNLKS